MNPKSTSAMEPTMQDMLLQSIAKTEKVFIHLQPLPSITEEYTEKAEEKLYWLWALFRAHQLKLWNAIDVVADGALPTLLDEHALEEQDIQPLILSLTNGIRLMDAMHQVLRAYKHANAAGNFGNLFGKISPLVQQWCLLTAASNYVVVKEEGQVPLLKFIKASDVRNFKVVPHVHGIYRGSLVETGSDQLWWQTLMIRDFIDVTSLQLRSFSAALTALRLLQTWPDGCISKKCSVRPPSTEDVHVFGADSPNDDRAALTVAGTYASLAMQIIMAIPTISKLQSLNQEDKTLLDLTFLQVVEQNVQMAELVRLVETIKHADRQLELASRVKEISTRVLLKSGPFTCLNPVNSQQHSEAIQEAKKISVLHAKRFDEVAKDNAVMTYVRLRSDSEDLTDAYSYFLLRIGQAIVPNGLATVARSESKLMKHGWNNDLFKSSPDGAQQYPLFLYGPFRRVFEPRLDNAAVAEAIDEDGKIIDMLRQGKSIMVLGFGASGAGKTSTLVQLSYKNADDDVIVTHPGIIACWLNALIGVGLQRVTLHVKEFKVNVSEKTNRAVVDIHTKEYDPSSTSVGDGGGLTSLMEDVVRYILNDEKGRVQSTPNNPDSSRTHVAASIGCVFEDGGQGFIHLVDLAGAEMPFTDVAEMRTAMFENEKRRPTQMANRQVLLAENYNRVMDSIAWSLDPFKYTMILKQNLPLEFSYKPPQNAEGVFLKPLFPNLALAGIKVFNAHNIADLSIRTLQAAKADRFVDFLDAEQLALPDTIRAVLGDISQLTHVVKIVDEWIRVFQPMNKGNINNFQALLPRLAVLAALAICIIPDIHINIETEHAKKKANDKIRYKSASWAACLATLVVAADSKTSQSWAEKLRALLEFTLSKVSLSESDQHQKRLDTQLYYKHRKEPVVKGLNDFVEALAKVGVDPVQIHGHIWNIMNPPQSILLSCWASVLGTPGLQKLKGETFNNVFSDLMKILTKIQGMLNDDKAGIEMLPQGLAMFLLHRFLKAHDLEEVIGNKVIEYMKLRNLEGSLINATLREIQDVIVYRARHSEGNTQLSKSASVDACGMSACNPLLPLSPCFHGDLLDNRRPPESWVLTEIEKKSGGSKMGEGKIVLMGVVDVGKNAKEPVVWQHDGNMTFMRQLYETLSSRDEVGQMEQFYKHAQVSVPVPSGRNSFKFGPFWTTKDFQRNLKLYLGEAMKNIEGNASSTPQPNMKEPNIKAEELRLKYMQKNQSSVVGILQFLDIMGKMGTIAPCMHLIDDERMQELDLPNTTVIHLSSRSTTA